jgi:hypothetical protein
MLLRHVDRSFVRSLQPRQLAVPLPNKTVEPAVLGPEGLVQRPQRPQRAAAWSELLRNSKQV